MRIAVAASPEAALPTLEWLLTSPHQLVRIFSQPDRPSGRGRVLTPTPVSQWAIKNSIELFRPESSIELGSQLSDIDLVITIGYGVLIPEDILAKSRNGFLNLHFSVLPRWRGAAPVQRAIEAGDSFTGVTVFKLDRGMDTGPIYSIHRFALDSDITSDELLRELSALGVAAVEESLSMIENGVKPTPQSDSGATKAAKLSRAEGEIDWSQSADAISAKIRAFTSNPGAWTTIRGSVHKLATPVLTDIELTAGEIEVRNKRVLFGTSTFALEIRSITPAGKSEMSSFAWANGARIENGQRCE